MEDEEGGGGEAEDEANEEGREGGDDEGGAEADEGEPPDAFACLLLVLHQDPHLRKRYVQGEHS